MHENRMTSKSNTFFACLIYYAFIEFKLGKRVVVYKFAKVGVI